MRSTTFTAFDLNEFCEYQLQRATWAREGTNSAALICMECHTMADSYGEQNDKHCIRRDPNKTDD